ncbi:hypothetical protein GCM10017711_23250 [Paeniglutamicibacter sulfureus]
MEEYRSGGPNGRGNIWRNAEGDGRYMALMEENSDRGFLAKWVLKVGGGKEPDPRFTSTNERTF